MSKVWLITLHQFGEEVFKRGFLIALVSLPLFLGVSIGAGYLAVQLEDETVDLGYVDEAGALRHMPSDPESYDVRPQAFATDADARAALEEGRIQSYYRLASDFSATGQAELIYRERPPWDARRYFLDALRLNLLAEKSPELTERAIEGPTITFRSAEDDRVYPNGDPSAGSVVTIVAAVVFVFAILSASGMMMQAVVGEKENRTMEIVLTSVSAGQMMTGKIVGIAAVALTQFVVWIACLVGAIWVAGNVLQVTWFQDVSPAWMDLLKLAAIAGPAFLFITASMTAVGGAMVETQEAQQLGGLLYLFLFVPVYMIVPIIGNPDGAVATVLGLLPITSVMTNAMRMMVWTVPVPQIAASAAISLVSAAGMVWLAGRALRIGMLRYGRRLKLRELFGQAARR